MNSTISALIVGRRKRRRTEKNIGDSIRRSRDTERESLSKLYVLPRAFLPCSLMCK